jgi:hypothetical protein
MLSDAESVDLCGVQDQEAGGSNPLAPTISFPKAYRLRQVIELDPLVLQQIHWQESSSKIDINVKRTGHQARPFDLLIDCAVPTGRPTCFGSALEGNKAAESRIREAVLSGFDVTRKPVLKSRVSGNRDDEVVPAMELIQ